MRSVYCKRSNIRNQVFIGSNIKILKGVTIGNGTLKANGSILVSKISSMVVAADNPAEVIKEVHVRS